MPGPSRLSIRIKWPLAVATLILLVGVTVSLAAYFGIRRSLLGSAEDRLMTLGAVYQESIRASQAAALGRLSSVVRRPALAAYLVSPATDREPAAREAMVQTGPAAENIVRTELRTTEGVVVLTTESVEAAAHLPNLAATPWETLARALRPPDVNGGVSTGYGELVLSGDAIFQSVVAEIPVEPGGYLVTWRRVSVSAQSRSQLATVMGSEAALYYGNISGGLWTDLEKRIEGPPQPLDLQGISTFERPGRGQVMAAVRPIAGTPFALSLEFPVAAVLTPAHRFLRIMASIALLCIAIGVGVSWYLSRRVTGQLQRLTQAADAIAAGEHWAWADAPRPDELGRLASSFNSMAHQIKESQQRLKGLVEERTGELRAAQDSLARREKLALVGQLAGSISHEIRNPLGVMTNAIYYLEAVQADAPPEVREYLNILKQQVNLSAKIVNDLLDLTRPTAVSREHVAVRSIVSSRRTAPESNRTFPRISRPCMSIPFMRGTSSTTS
jgi:signal transduction histidine kinase